MNVNDFGFGAEAQCRSPAAGSGADDGMGVADLFAAVTVFKNIFNHEIKRKNLPVVGMSGKLEVYGIVNSFLNVHRIVIQKHDKVVFRGAFNQFAQRAASGNEFVVTADNGNVAEIEAAVFQHRQPRALQSFYVFGDFTAVIFMVADNGKISLFAVKFFEFGGKIEGTEMVGCAFNDVSGENGKIRIKLVNLVGDFRHLIQSEAAVVDMKVGD